MHIVLGISKFHIEGEREQEELEELVRLQIFPGEDSPGNICKQTHETLLLHACMYIY